MVPETLKGEEAYARCVSKAAYGRRTTPVERQQAKGQDALGGVEVQERMLCHGGIP